MNTDTTKSASSGSAPGPSWPRAAASAKAWIWLTHTDFDHIGSLSALLEANPHVRVITSFLGVGIMGCLLYTSPSPRD